MAGNEGKKRHKTDYPGVYYRLVESLTRPGQKERVYIVSFKRDGRIIEARAGYQFKDAMTPARAAQYRFQLIERKALTPQEKKLAEKARHEAEARKMTMKKLWDHFKTEKQNLASFRSDEGRWRLHLEPVLGDMDPADLTRDHLKPIMEKLDREGRSEATKRQVVVLLKRIVNLGAYDGKCPPLNFKYKMAKINNARDRYLSRDEANALMAALKRNERGQQTYYMSKLSLNTGARFREIACLKWADINLEQRTIFVGNSKNGFARTLHMNDEIFEMFQSMKKGNPQDLVFPSRVGAVMDQISRLFFRTVKDLGLNEGIEDARQKVCFHTLRHTFASWAVIEGCDIYRLKEVLGHKVIEMTLRYAHLAPDAGKQVVNLVGSHQSGVTGH